MSDKKISSLVKQHNTGPHAQRYAYARIQKAAAWCHAAAFEKCCEWDLKSTINIQQSTINHFFGVITVLPSASLVISMS